MDSGTGSGLRSQSGEKNAEWCVLSTKEWVDWGLPYCLHGCCSFFCHCVWLCGDSGMMYVACVTVWWQWYDVCCMCDCGDSVMRCVACVTVVTVLWGVLYVWLWWQCYDVCCMCDCGDSVMSYVACVVTVLWGMLHMWLCGDSVNEVCCICDCVVTVLMRYVVCMTACCGCVMAGCWMACSAHFVIVYFLMAVWRCMWRTESLPASFWMKWKWGPVTLF